MEPKRLVLVGAGGHASDVLGVVEAQNAIRQQWQVVGVLADDAPTIDRLGGRQADFRGGIERLAELDARWLVAVGSPAHRRAIVARAITFSKRVAGPLVHPLADVGHGVELEAGAVVLGQSRLSPRAALGEHACLSYHASVGHDSRLGAYSSVMPGAVVAGDVTIGEGVLVGAGAVVLQGRLVGDGASIGAGAVVVEDVSSGETVVGVPARRRE
jgi:sugar O-acyltransferase (sialic acid O-acetyltransferase NeuD family)